MTLLLPHLLHDLSHHCVPSAAFPSLQSLGSLFRLLEDDPNDFKQGDIFSAEKIEASPVFAEQDTGMFMLDILLKAFFINF